MENLNLPPFYVGQKVIYITGNNMKKDTVHTVRAVGFYPCGCRCIKIDTLSPVRDVNFTHFRCVACKKVYHKSGFDPRDWMASSFIPFEELPFQSLTMKEVVKKESQLISLN